jgi:putative heme iron utilization protein
MSHSEESTPSNAARWTMSRADPASCYETQVQGTYDAIADQPQASSRSIIQAVKETVLDCAAASRMELLEDCSCAH